MKNPNQLINLGRGILDPARTTIGPAQGPAKRVARLEAGEEGLGPLLASAPRLASILARLCVAANMRDSVTLARLIHEAETALDTLNWDWGDASHIINPKGD